MCARRGDSPTINIYVRHNRTNERESYSIRLLPLQFSPDGIEVLAELLDNMLPAPRAADVSRRAPVSVQRRSSPHGGR